MTERSPRSLSQGVLFAAAGGLLLASAFEPTAWWPMAVAGIAVITPAFRVARLRHALMSGLVAGLAFNLVVLRWVAVVGADAWLVLGAYCSLWLVLIAGATWFVRRLRWWPVVVAAIWVCAEGVRSNWPWGGFAWGRLGFSQVDGPAAGLVAIGGVPLVGFTVVLSGVLLAHWAAGRSLWRTRLWQPAISIAIIAVGSVVPRATQGESIGGPSETVAAVVQGGVPGTGLDAFSERQVVLTNHVTATENLAGAVDAGTIQAPQYVIWPENASDLDPLRSTAAAALIDQAADAIRVPILVGAVIEERGTPTTLLNAGIVWSPDTGPGETYVKRHLVPFGEFVPFRPVLTALIKRYDRVPFDFRAGTSGGVLQLGPARIGDVICFEIADDAIVRDEVVGGARVLAVQTNNATYSATAEPEQQLAMTRLRAIEHGRTVLIAATSGKTAIVSPDGAVTAAAAANSSESIVRQVPMRDTLTAADRWGWVIEPVALLLMLIGFASAALAGRSDTREKDALGSDWPPE